LVAGSSGWFGHAPFAHALASELDLGIVNNAIENCVGERRIADDVMPAIDRHLAGEKDRTGVVAVLDDFEQVAGRLDWTSWPSTDLFDCLRFSQRRIALAS
jgi:hypothetical protein